MFVDLLTLWMQGQCILGLTFARNYVEFPLFEGENSGYIESTSGYGETQNAREMKMNLDGNQLSAKSHTCS